MKINTDTLFNRLSQFVIIGFLIVFLILSAYAPVGPNGESGNYIISTLAFERHPFSQRILPGDIEQVKYDHPEHYEHMKDKQYFVADDGSSYPYYFPTYSISVIPMKWLLKALGQATSRAYAFSNTLFYTLALVSVYIYLKVSRKTIFLTILLLACSPAIVYYWWVSAEMFICSLMIITMVFWINGDYKVSGLFCSVASSLNITICIVCFAIIFDHLLNEYVKPEISVKTAIKQNWKKTLFLAPYFVPALFMPIFNLYICGSITLQTSILTSNDLKGQAGRMLAYLFDLNLGFLPFLPLLLVLFFIMGVIGIKKRNKRVVFVFLSFFAVVALYSLMPHINCGMTAISRYNAWSSPILIIGVTALFPDLIQSASIKSILPKVSVVSALISVVVVIVSMKSNWGNAQTFSPVAKAVMNTVPTLYNPLPSMFVCRTLHVDGGYDYSEKPLFYADENNVIKKILVPQGTADMVLERVYGDTESIAELMEKLEKIKVSNKEYTYINLYSNILLDHGYKNTFDPLSQDNLDSISKGIYWDEGTYHWFSPDATIYLRAGTIPKNGLKIDFSIPELEKIDLNKPFITDIFIDKKKIKTIELNDITVSEPQTITIDSKDISENESGIYEIRLLTNGVYNPFNSGHSSDNRDLALRVSYIGPNE